MARTPGSSPYDDADKALVVDMEILIVYGVAPDMKAAARMLEHKAPGSEHGDARRRRLVKKYRKYGPEALRADGARGHTRRRARSPACRRAGGPARRELTGLGPPWPACSLPSTTCSGFKRSSSDRQRQERRSRKPIAREIERLRRADSRVSSAELMASLARINGEAAPELIARPARIKREAEPN